MRYLRVPRSYLITVCVQFARTGERAAQRERRDFEAFICAIDVDFDAIAAPPLQNDDYPRVLHRH